MPHEEKLLPARAVTRGPKQHFFGYYDKSPWDSGGRYLLALETDFNDRPPRAEDIAEVGLIDTAEGNSWRRLGETSAWNWQQGTMLQWLPGASRGAPTGPRIIYNVRAGGTPGTALGRTEGAGDRFGAVIHEVFSGERRVLPRPVYALSPAGGAALSDNFARLAHTRPGYGYAPGSLRPAPPVPDSVPGKGPSLDLADPAEAGPTFDRRTGGYAGYAGYVGTSESLADRPAPDDDGVYWMDLETGECRLIVSLAQAAALRPKPSMEGAFHWINHIQWNVDGTRFAFLHRWHVPEAGQKRSTRLATADPRGSDIRILADEDMISHYDWLDADRVLAWARRAPLGDRYFLFTDTDPSRAKVVGEGILTCDGHCSYSPDRRWILTDTYPDRESRRTLILYDTLTSRRIDVGRFHAPPELAGEIRVDLHPRWSRDGRLVCFDSAHEGSRQMYVMDVSEVVGT